MHSTTLRCLALVALTSTAFAPPAEAAEDANAARRAKIMANLEISFPQLQTLEASVTELKATDIDGLDEGTLVVNGKPQSFLVTRDDKKLYLVSAAIDASRSAEEIAAERAKQEAEELAEATRRTERLAAAVADRPFRGTADAPITVVEFSDFQCPFCTRGAATMEQLLKQYEGKVKFVFLNFPLNFHPWAEPAAIAAQCAANQKADAFWTLHDAYFEHQATFTVDNVLAKSKEYLAGSGIDLAQWSTCAEDKSSETHRAAAEVVRADMSLGQQLGVSGTPGFFINGQFLNGAQPLPAFAQIIDPLLKN
jgi:protein-disulfide isomerase